MQKKAQLIDQGLTYERHGPMGDAPHCVTSNQRHHVHHHPLHHVAPQHALRPSHTLHVQRLLAHLHHEQPLLLHLHHGPLPYGPRHSQPSMGAWLGGGHRSVHVQLRHVQLDEEWMWHDGWGQRMRSERMLRFDGKAWVQWGDGGHREARHHEGM